MTDIAFIPPGEPDPSTTAPAAADPDAATTAPAAVENANDATGTSADTTGADLEDLNIPQEFADWFTDRETQHETRTEPTTPATSTTPETSAAPAAAGDDDPALAATNDGPAPGDPAQALPPDASPAGSPEPSPTTPPTTSSSAPEFVELAGQQVPVAYLQAALETQAWVESLTPEQARAVAQAFQQPQPYPPQSPQQVPPSAAPAPPYSPTPSLPGAGAVPPVAAPGGAAPVSPPVGAGGAPDPSTPTAPDLSAIADFAPGLPEYLQSLQATIAQQNAVLEQMRYDQFQQSQLELARQRDEINKNIDTTKDAFAEANSLDPSTVDTLMQRVAHRQMMPTLTQSHNGNVAAALNQALEFELYSDPQLRNTIVQSQIEAAQAQDHEIAQRRQRAASLTGTAAHLPRTPQPLNPVAMTHEQRQAAMEQEIAAALNGNGQGS